MFPHTSIRLFADDAKLFSTKPEDLQQSLNRVDLFLKERQLDLAIEKCEKLSISKNKDTHDFTIDSKPLCEALTVEDLGVHILNDLTWEVTT